MDKLLLMWKERQRLRRPSLPVLLVLCAMPLRQALAQPEMKIEIRDSRVYMQVQERSLNEALTALARAGDFQLKTNDPFADPVSIRVQGVSMSVAIRRLLRQHSSVMIYATSPAGERVLRELRVYKANQGQAPTARVRRGKSRTGAKPAAKTLDLAKLAELTRLLSSGSTAREQRQAITELRGIGGDAAVQALSLALQLPDKTVRSYAVAVLGQIGSPQAVQLLGNTATVDQEADVRIRAVIALARQHGEPARQFVQIVATRDAEERVRDAAQARLNAW